MTDDSRRKIAYLFNHPFFLGGGEVSLFDLMRFLDKNRFSPVAFLPAPGEIQERIESQGLPAHVCPLPSLKGVTPWRPFSAMRKWVAKLSSTKPALLHANGSRACLYSVLAGRILGMPVLWHVRETVKDLAMYDRLLFTLSRAVVCVSESVKDKRFGFIPPGQKGKTYVVYNGIDPGQFKMDLSARQRVREELGIGEKEILFAIVANYIPLKAHDFFLKAAAALRDSDPALSFKVLLIGRPLNVEFYARLRRLTAEIQMEDKVLFREHTHRIAEIYSALDIFVLPSTREGFSRSLLEAMSTGLPVLATQLSEIQEAVVDGENGFLVRHGDVEGLSQAALALAKDRGLRGTMGASNRTKVEEKFSLIAHARAMERVYSSILGDRD